MKTFAIIEDGIVTNVIVAETKKQASDITKQECVEYTESNPAHIGLSYDGNQFEQPFYEVADVPTGTE
jgi:hypothetical protein